MIRASAPIRLPIVALAAYSYSALCSALDACSRKRSDTHPSNNRSGHSRDDSQALDQEERRAFQTPLLSKTLKHLTVEAVKAIHREVLAAHLPKFSANKNWFYVQLELIFRQASVQAFRKQIGDGARQLKYVRVSLDKQFLNVRFIIENYQD